MTSLLLEFRFCAHYFIGKQSLRRLQNRSGVPNAQGGFEPTEPLKHSRRTSQEAEQQEGEGVEVGAALYHYVGALRCRDDSVGQSRDCRRPGDVTTNYFSLCMENSS